MSNRIKSRIFSFAMLQSFRCERALQQHPNGKSGHKESANGLIEVKPVKRNGVRGYLVSEQSGVIRSISAAERVVSNSHPERFVPGDLATAKRICGLS